MAILEGYGPCGICHQQIETPTPPLRHFRDNMMAHKSCMDKKAAHELTPEYKIEQAQLAVEAAEMKLNSARYDLEVAQSRLAEVLRGR